MFANTILLEVQPPLARGRRSILLPNSLNMFLYFLMAPFEAPAAPQNQVHEVQRQKAERRVQDVVREREQTPTVRPSVTRSPVVSPTRTFTPATPTPTMTYTPSRP